MNPVFDFSHYYLRDAGGLGAWQLALLVLVCIGMAIALAIQPVVIAGLTAALLIAIGCAVRPLAALVAIMIVVALLGSDSIFGFHAGIQWVEVDLLLMVAVLGWCGRWLITGTGKQWSRLDLIFVLFGAAIVFGVYRGLSNGITLDAIRPELRPPAYLIFVYAISRYSVRELRQARWVFRVLLFATLLSALKALIVFAIVPLGAAGAEEQVIWATRVMNSDGFKRVIPHGAEPFPVLMGLYVLPTFVRSPSVKRRFLGWSILSVLVGALAVSMTRSYWVGLAAGLVCLVISHWSRVTLRGILEMTGVVVLLVGILYALQDSIPGLSLSLIGEQLQSRAHGASISWDPSAVARIAEFEAISDTVAENPWTGTGLGGTYMLYSSMVGGIREWEYTHNSYAYWALKLGIPGFLIVLAVLGFGISSGIGWLRRSATERERALASGLLAGLVALACISLTAPWLTHYVGAAWAGLVLGCTESMRLSHEHSTGEDR